MKLTPITGDFVVKAIAGAVIVSLFYWAAKKVGGAVSEAAAAAVDTVGDAAYAVSPLNNKNVIYQAANVVTGGDNKTSSLGTRIYDFFH